MKTFMIRQNGDLLVNLIEIKSDRCRDEIGHSYLVIGNRIMGWESWGQAMPHRRLKQHATHKLRAPC